ncbi:MAG: MarR family transcriptional regulator [Calditrichaeota bacterium]|nr:MAG: MarR family transcriptional regulator [Calditrichota bacterium]MBL1207438.1 MarR family transcriptional regulator [Calditrichota bacterium]NOG47270.1 MarR family transcriptional regulator [Calditrichota bacterium]
MFKFDESVGFLINRVAKQFKRKLDSAFKKNGYTLTPEHWAVLNRLWEKDGLSQTEIADLTFKDKANITRILDVMEKNSLVKRQKHELDRRSFKIFLDSKGKEYKSQLVPFAHEINQKALKNLGEEEMAILKKVMIKISNNLD